MFPDKKSIRRIESVEDMFKEIGTDLESGNG